MSYVAKFQQYDDVIYTVAEGDDLATVTAAATAVYIALLPSILKISRANLDTIVDEEAEDKTSSQWTNQQMHQADLAALECGEYAIAVYEGDNLVFWVGAGTTA